MMWLSCVFHYDCMESIKFYFSQQVDIWFIKLDDVRVKCDITSQFDYKRLKYVFCYHISLNFIHAACIKLSENAEIAGVIIIRIIYKNIRSLEELIKDSCVRLSKILEILGRIWNECKRLSSEDSNGKISNSCILNLNSLLILIREFSWVSTKGATMISSGFI